MHELHFTNTTTTIQEIDKLPIELGPQYAFETLDKIPTTYL